jgi:AhpC/TSA family
MLEAPGNPAPEWATTRWFNHDAGLTLAGLSGRIVALHAFQMLCPGCVQHGLPQAQRLHALFGEAIAVVGLHTVFEHHEAMTPVSLAAFLHEYRVRFPVGVDEPSADGPIPRTMAAYGLQGTPSLLLIDRQGSLRWRGFGAADDLAVGAMVGTLLAES